MDTFNIKPGYKPNLTQQTLDAEGGNYWNERRISDSRLFQYYVYEMCRELLAENGRRSFMDIGCGPATKVESLIQPVCQDITLIDQPSSADMIAKRVPTATFFGLNLEELDLDLGRKFDVIVCADVIEHLVDPLPCLDFIRDHLAPNGTAVISTPERDIVRGTNCISCPKAEHVREWNSAEFKAFLRGQGFAVDRQELFPEKRTGKLSFLLSQTLGRVWRTQTWAGCQVAVCRLGEAQSNTSPANNLKAA